MIADVLAWAAATGIAVTAGQSLHGGGDFRVDPRLDFGRYLRRVPAFVVRPQSIGQLAECMQLLARLSLPYTVRGSGHSAGGQTLSDGGAVVLTSGLDRIVQDDPACETIGVEAGITWLALFEHLRPQGRRPLVLTDNLRTSIGGTLAVGGFGDASHLHGAQAECVSELVLVAPDGAVHQAEAGDRWFDESLYGEGRLGVIARATVKTVRRSSQLSGRMLSWRTVADFVADAIDVASGARYEYFRARVQWDNTVTAVAGNLDGSDPSAPTRISAHGPLETLDLAAVAAEDPHARWAFYAPNLELVLPLPSGMALWATLRAQLDAWTPHMPRGASVMVVPTTSRLPLAPLPKESSHALLIALRLELPTAVAARAAVPWLRRLAQQAIEAGAKIYRASITV